MPKYSPINVVKIKKEIEKYSSELSLILSDIKISSNELENIRVLVRSEQEKVANLWDDIAKKLAVTQKAKQQLEQEISSLVNNRSILESNINVLNNLLLETTKKLSEIPTKNTLLDSLIVESKKILETITRQKERKESELKVLMAEKEKLGVGISLMKDQESSIINKLEELNKSVSSLLKEKQSYTDLIEEIKKRDHNSKVMAQRLTEEYKQVYFSRKKDAI
jgi:chromosome segregation ATPase